MDRHGLAIVAGMQVLSLETLLLGWFGWISTRWPLVLVLVASIVVATFLRQRFRDSTRSTLFDTRWPMCSPSRDLQSISSAARRSIGFLCLSVTFLGLLILLGGILPPIEFDVREYHLQAPKEFFQNGRIAFVEHNIYANMPLGAEMHALAWMVLLGGPNDWFLGAIIGKGIIAMFAVFGAMVVGGTAYRAVGPVGGWVAAASFLGCPGIAEISRHGLVDVVVACYGLCGFVVLWHVWVQMKAKGTLHQADSFLVGWFLGGSAACKYTAYPMLVVPGLLLFLCAIVLAMDGTGCVKGYSESFSSSGSS